RRWLRSRVRARPRTTHGTADRAPVQHRASSRHLAAHHRQLRCRLLHHVRLQLDRRTDSVHRSALCRQSHLGYDRSLPTTVPTRRIPLAAVRDAATAVYAAAVRTPLVRVELPAAPGIASPDLYLKLEVLQPI